MSVPIQTTNPTNPEATGAAVAQREAASARGEGAAVEDLFDALLSSFGATPSAEERAELAVDAEAALPEVAAELEVAVPDTAAEAEEADLGAAREELDTEESENHAAAQGAEGALAAVPVAPSAEQATGAVADGAGERPGPQGAEREAQSERALAAGAERVLQDAASEEQRGEDASQDQAAARARDARALEAPRANGQLPFPEVAQAGEAAPAPAANARALEAPRQELRAVPELPANNENEIVRSSQLLAREGGGQARIQLVPPQLGQLDLRVSVTENAVQISMTAERGQVAELLARHVPELRDLLQTQGLQVDRIDVELNERETSGERARGGGQQEPDRKGSARSEREASTVARQGDGLPGSNPGGAQGSDTRGGISAVDVRV